MAEKSVSVRLSARVDAYVAAMKRAEAATGLTAKSIRNIEKVGGQIQSVGSSLTKFVSLPLAAAGLAATKMAMDYDTAFAHMVGLAGAPADEVDRLKESVLDLAGATGQAPMELADALYQAMSSGLDTADAMEAVDVAAHAAAAGLGSSADIVSLAASAMTSYAESGLTAAEATDILTATIREGRADPDELAGSLGRILPVASRLGVSFDEVGGATAYLSNVFGDTNRTVTALSGVFNKLLAPTAQGRAALAEYGLSVEQVQAAISQDGLLGALELLNSSGLAGNSQALRAVFDDVEAFQGAQALLAADTATLTGIFDATKNSAGAMGDAFAVVAQTDGFKMKQSLAELQVALIKIGDILLPFAADASAAIADLARWFSDLPAPIQDAAVALGALAAAGGPVIMMVGSLLRNWSSLQAGIAASSGPTQKAAKALGAIGIIAGTAYAAWNILGEGELNASAHVDTASGALERQTQIAFDNAVAAGEASTRVDALAIANQALSLAIAESADDQMVQWLANLNIAAADTLDTLNGFRSGGDAFEIQLLADSFNLTTEQATMLHDAITQFNFGEDDITQGLRDSLRMTDEQILEISGSLKGLDQYAIENTAEIDAMARATLDWAVSLGGASQEAVLAAEAIAGSRMEAGNATAVYEEYLNQLILLDPAAAAAALQITSVGTASSDAASGVADMAADMSDAEDVAASSIDVYDDLARAFDAVADNADDMREAVRRAIDPAVNLTEASEDVWAAAIGFGDAIDENSRSLAISTEAGQTNRDVIEEWADSIWAMTDAQIGNGESIADVTAAWWHNRDALIATAREAGFTEEDINSLLTEYGLTPESLDTAIRLYGDEQAAEDLQAVLDSMEDIPAELATEIQTDIDEGSLQSARLKLEQFTRTRETVVAITVTGAQVAGRIIAGLLGQMSALNQRRVSGFAVGAAAGVVQSAAGRYVPAGSNMLTTVGEAGPEVILPLDNPARMSTLLSMPEVARHLSPASGITTYTTVQYNTINMPPGSDGDDVVRALKQYERRSGPIPIRTR